ncbi:hypothetical protein ABI924_08925, partial [Chromobacterium phragmitis]
CPTGGIDIKKAPEYLALPNVLAVGGIDAAAAGRLAGAQLAGLAGQRGLAARRAAAGRFNRLSYHARPRPASRGLSARRPLRPFAARV